MIGFITFLGWTKKHITFLSMDENPYPFSVWMMYEKEKDKRGRGYVLGKALGGGHSQSKGPHMRQS
jgi:hypothetical protein